jgi:hypothetical protein
MRNLSLTCGAGHPFTDKNTYRSKTGRQCRRCRADRTAAFRARKRDQGLVQRITWVERKAVI